MKSLSDRSPQRPPSSSGILSAADAIPLKGVRLSEAFNIVYWLVRASPELFREKLDTNWLAALRLNKDRDQNSSSQLADEVELAYIDRCANILLRQELQSGVLRAYVRDPDSGDVLKLASENWIPDDWVVANPLIPATGILSDFINEDYSEASRRPFEYVFGPPGSIIRGQRRPVFLLTDEFEAWAAALKSAIVENGRIGGLAKAHQQLAVEEAVYAIYGKNGVPLGVRAVTRNKAIKRWLDENGRQVPSDSTIGRSLAAMRLKKQSRDP